MTSPGWYPDPSGQQGMFRYWDGSGWTEALTADPASAAPPTGQPGQQPGQSVQQPGQQAAWSQQSYADTGAPAGASGGRSGGKLAAIIAVVVLLVAGLGVGGFFGVRALTGGDDKSGDSSSSGGSSKTAAPSQAPTTGSSPSAAPTSNAPSSAAPPAPSAVPPAPGARGACTSGRPVENKQPPTASTYRGGGLSIPRVAGYGTPKDQSAIFTFASGVTVAYKLVTKNWISLYALGTLSKPSGFSSPQASAQAVFNCMANSPQMYAGTTGHSVTGSGALTVKGHPAYSLNGEIRVSDPKVKAKGDVIHIIVVDTGSSDTLGLYIAATPIGDTQLAQVEKQTASQLSAG